MALRILLAGATRKSIVFFTLLFIIQSVAAQNQTDTTRKSLLAALEKKGRQGYTIKRSNVIFPEILKGNEEEMLPYIEKFCSKRRDYLVRMYTKGKSFFPKTTTILKKYDLPAELRILLTLESAYNGNAVSKAGAVGYWQIMDQVAGEYGMKYVARLSFAEKKKLLKLKGKKGDKKYAAAIKLKDDRKNFIIATHTAARYLRDRSRNLDDNWLLVVASYNCGVGNVWKAMKRSGKANPGFWDIKTYLPAETRAYVMNFITLNVIFNNYEMFAKHKLSFAPEKIILAADLEKNATNSLQGYSDR
ncbi:MAG: lytic transglycosylase domain-containing protein [Ferruginibacter sp.]